MGFTARALNIEEFGDYGAMFFYLTFGHTGLVDGLDLRLGASFGTSLNDNIDDHHLWLWLGVDYALTANLVPRLNLHFVQGGTWGFEQSTHHWAVRNNFTFNGEQAFINIMPSVQVRVLPSAFVELGAFIHQDLGDDPSRGTGANMRHNGLNAGLFVLTQVSF